LYTVNLLEPIICTYIIPKKVVRLALSLYLNRLNILVSLFIKLFSRLYFVQNFSPNVRYPYLLYNFSVIYGCMALTFLLVKIICYCIIKSLSYSAHARLYQSAFIQINEYQLISFGHRRMLRTALTAFC